MIMSSFPNQEHIDIATQQQRIEPSAITNSISEKIMNFRGEQVMIDRDLAELYGVETKVLNQAVKRNIERFPSSFRFQLNDSEKDKLVANCDRFSSLKHSSVNPYVFTEQGVAMLSAVLKSDTAVSVSIRIMDAFVKMRRFLLSNAMLFQRMEQLELRQLRTDNKILEIMDQLQPQLPKKEGIFFNGQIFDAYILIAELIKKADSRIVVIDNYVDDSVLLQLSKRKPHVSVHIYDGQISRQLRQDVERHNAQYPGVTLHHYSKAHDRFLVIDEEVYHIGASLKDLGKKLFAFSKMEATKGSELIERINSEI